MRIRGKSCVRFDLVCVSDIRYQLEKQDAR